MPNLSESLTAIRSWGSLINVPLSMAAISADLTTHNFDGKAILPLRYNLKESLGNGEFAYLIAESIGNFGHTAAIIAPFTIVSELLKDQYLKTNNEIWKCLSIAATIIGSTTAIGLNIYIESVTPNNYQFVPDVGMGVFAAIQTDTTIKGLFDAKRLYLQNLEKEIACATINYGS